MIVVQILLLGWIAAIGYKLVRLQISDHTTLLARAERQQQASIDLSPTRGVIYDRNGSVLARSVTVKSLYAAPADISDAVEAADKLSRLLDVDRDTLYKRLTSQTQVLVAVKRKLSEDEAKQVDDLGLRGLRFVNEMKRYYVSGAVASHVLGFVDVDERGQGGIELNYDKQIRGQNGRLLLDVDALKKSYDHSVEESVPGADISLTLDLTIQRNVELALARAVRASHARGGTIVMIRPSTGEILALANYPSFDPNDVSDTSDEQRRNRAVEMAFEPGSIFKLVTYSAALEERLIRPDTLIDCGNGQIKIADRIVHDGHYGVLTAAKALAKSSNVAAIKIGMRLGQERLGAYVEQFGFGKRTGIELPAESRGVFRPASEWSPTTMGSIPMGHEIGVTAVQAVAAYGCIANGGMWVRPHLTGKITSSSGDTLDEYRPEFRRVVSEATAATLKSMLEGVVLQGTGKAARLRGYTAAGKTGTAQKIDERSGRYSNTKYVASFVGFAPVENPEVACIVSIDEPVGAHHGGDVAAPVFAQVVSEALHVLGTSTEPIPDSLVASDFQVYEMPGLIADNDPAATVTGEDGPAIQVVETNQPDAASKRYGSVIVPDLSGRGIREAVTLCAARGLRLEASGDGIVSNQVPAPGLLVPKDAVCRVKLSKGVDRRRQPQEDGEPARAARTN
jgi:cell division protein FtsI (penicillin-binding protein 3)